MSNTFGFSLKDVLELDTLKGGNAAVTPPHLEVSGETVGTFGRAMSHEFMSEVAARNPHDRVVMFLVESRTYITAQDDTALLDKYAALHQNEWGWVTDIARGPSGTDSGVGRP